MKDTSLLISSAGRNEAVTVLTEQRVQIFKSVLGVNFYDLLVINGLKETKLLIDLQYFQKLRHI